MMIKKYIKFILIFFSFLLTIITIVFTYNIVVPDNYISEIKPNQNPLKIKQKFKDNLESELEIYKIINPTQSEKISINKETVKKEIFENKKIHELNKKNFRLQFGATKTKKNIEKSYLEIKEKVPKFLINDKPYIQKIEIPDKGIFYRMQSFETFEKKEALKVCQILKEEGMKCLIIKNL
ncbi:MAG: hypothetical protein CMP41_00215 [Rickettsiales bacterium]|nr:hypothetical protein [Rickettsiales bacterium]|tara:strand:+ start:85 stop:624 length:540 start_codon:yes stop_codon:yes gene_type:complete